MDRADLKPAGEASALWRASDFPSRDAFAYDLTPAHVAALEKAVTVARASGKSMTDTTKADFPLGDAAYAIAAIGHEVTQGRGFVLARGFPADRLALDDMVWMYWGIGCHWGRAVSQSLRGDRLGHVLDASKGKPGARGYRSSQELHFHNDSDDIVGLLCLRQGKSGGDSLLLNALGIHDALLRENPAALALLYEGWRYDWNNQAPPGEPPITPYKVPVFSRAVDDQGRDKVSVVYLRGHITDAAKELTGGLSAADQA
ncbi:MAG: TauD/TfdA family dioxygenase, partial [Alphaproteobacteria bacterium]